MGRTACTEPQCLYKGALYLTLPAAIEFRTFCHPGWNLKTLCQRYRTVILSVVSCTSEIFGVPNRILPDTVTELFKAHKTGTNGIPISGRFPIRNPVGTQAIRLGFFMVFRSSWRQHSGYYLKFDVHVSKHRKYKSKLLPKRMQRFFVYTWSCMYSYVLLMMGGGTAWNM